MPAKKKDVKHDEPVFADSEGVFIHEAEQARYSGGVRTLTSGVLPSSMIANNPSLASVINNNNSNLNNGEADNAIQGGGSGGTGKGNSPSKKSKNKFSAGSSTGHNSNDNKLGNAASTSVGLDGYSSGNKNIDGGASTFGIDNVLRFRHGTGTYISPELRYCGQWKDDVMHGNGTLEFKMSGATYSGEFANGMFCGRGKYMWADGSWYDGLWANNKMHGLGTFTDEHGQIWNGVYYNGTGPGLERLYRAEANRVARVGNEICANKTDTLQ